MSGTGQLQQAYGALVGITSIAAAPFSGGVTLAGLPGALATVRHGTRQVQSENRQARNLQNSLTPKQIKPTIIPTINEDKVQKSRLSVLQSLQQRTGRASTLLTSQSGQNNTFG